MSTSGIIKKIFRDFWAIMFIELSGLYSPDHWKSIVDNVSKMLSCGETSNGYAEYICPCCKKTKKICFTCKSRFCTSCGKRYIDEWVEKMVYKIFDVPHRHLIFTIPQELREIFRRDRSLLKFMMDCVSQVILEVFRSRGRKVVPGILAVIHTFGGDIKFNPHIHVLVTEGGLTGDQWVDISFIPYTLLRKKWQYHLLTGLKSILPKTKENARFIDYLFKSQPKGFYVNGEKKMTSVRYATRYLGRYLARPALAEYRIVHYDGQKVTFWYKDHDTKGKKYATLEVDEFIKLLIEHIPLKGFKMVRHYGLYSRRSKSISMKVLLKCKRFLQLKFSFLNNDSERLNWRQRLIRSFGKDPLICSACKEEMLLWYIWHPKYGYLFDLSRDGPFHQDVKELLQTVKSDTEQPYRHIQLPLFEG